MMMTDITTLQREILSLFDGIGEAIYLDLVPKMHDERLQSYILVQMRTQIRDLGAYGQTTLTIHAVARNREGGQMNATEIDRMTKAVMELLPHRGSSFSILTPQVTPFRGMTGFSYATITSTLRIE